MNKMKKMFAGVLALVMVVTGFVVAPKQADAAVPEAIVYDNTEFNIKDYWPTKTAPVKPGYVFGGWYKSANENDYMTADEAQAAVANGTAAYAKFVPAQVLSIKAQNEAGVSATSETGNVRVMTSLDSKNYEKVGFEIWLRNRNQLLKADSSALETANMYDGLMVGTEERTANAIYGGVSQFVSVWQLGNIPGAHFDKIVYVRPYWVTKDGTTATGLAKYVHVEDQYEGYISVPVNLLGGESVAAGVLNLTYDTALQLAGTEEFSFEAGRMLPTMKFKYDSANKTVKMVGNVLETGNASGECLYANIRFKAPAATTTFTVNPISFANWNEDPVTPKVWDVQYAK